MRNPKLMRRRVNVSMLDLGRIKSDQEAMGKYCAHIISIFPPFLEDDLLLHSGSVQPPITHFHSCIFFNVVHIDACSIPFSKFIIIMLVVVYLYTHYCGQGSISTKEFVKRTDWVPLMSALLLFNITTEHTLNSRHGLCPLICKCAPSLHW